MNSAELKLFKIYMDGKDMENLSEQIFKLLKIWNLLLLAIY